MQEQNPRQIPFNPSEHLMQIKSRNGTADYLPVQWRIVWFRSLCPDGVIETEMVHLDLDKETEEEVYQWNNDLRRSEKVIKRAPGFAVFRATVKDGRGGVAQGTKSEKAASFGDYIEKAETGAIGRALAALGYGTQFTGDEFDENQRIADAPVNRSANTNNTANKPAQGSHAERKAAPVSQAPAKPAEVKIPTTRKEQEGGIARMCGKLKMEVPDLGALSDEDVERKYRELFPIWDIARKNNAA